jgi:membrane protein implicated in regulation of membrane protease activity
MAAAVVFLILELSTPTFVFFCFMTGSIAAGIVAQWIAPDSILWQVACFAVLSIALIPFSRKIAERFTAPPPTLSNVDRMIGTVAIVTKAIDPDNGGQIKYEGEYWLAYADEKIPKNAKVKIVSVSGTKLHVEKVDQ